MNFTALGYKIEVKVEKVQKQEEPLGEDVAYTELNNLYLKCERQRFVTLYQRLRLESLVTLAYPDAKEFMRDWWFGEFLRLEGWLDV